jgi:hypothetical protein
MPRYQIPSATPRRCESSAIDYSLGPEERAFAWWFAQALNHTAALVAANPDAPQIAGSLGDRVKRAFTGMEPDEQASFTRGARHWLSRSDEASRRLFGGPTPRPDANSTQRMGLDPELTAKLERAVATQMERHNREIGPHIAHLAQLGLLKAPVEGMIRTTLETGYFTGDIPASWTEVTLQTPDTIHCRWKTEESAAETGLWKLTRREPSGKEIVIAWGNAGKAPGGLFAVKLSDYLPAMPASAPSVYRLRVIPSTKPAMKANLAATTQHEADQFQKIPGEVVGSPSNPVVITYATSEAPQLLDILSVYRELRFQISKVVLVEDQFGSGPEEFHIAGFVQENQPLESSQPSVQHKFRFDRTLVPGKYMTAWINYDKAPFWLSNPTTGSWPRAYTVVTSVIERDNGKLIAEWQAAIWHVAEELLREPMTTQIKEILSSAFAPYTGDDMKSAFEDVKVIADIVAKAISGALGTVLGVIIMVVGFFVTSILSGSGDDFYGSEVVVFVLPSNLSDYVTGLPGDAVPGGRELASQKMIFKGLTAWPESTFADYDGRLDVYFRWTFGKQQDLP